MDPVRAAFPTYQVITVGANVTPFAEPLVWAEKDAVDLAAVFTGALGPADSATVLIGEMAQRYWLDAAFADAARSRPDYLIFAFSGHGTPGGIALEDGMYPYAELRRQIRRIGARGSIVILDNCHAGAFLRNAVVGSLGGLDDAWVELLASATPGTRVLAATPSWATTGEHDALENGHFTYALKAALTAPRRGDLAGGLLVSDHLAFQRARRIMRRFGISPRAAGVRGDFPLVRSHELPVGAVSFVGARCADSGWLELDVRLDERHSLPTFIDCIVLDGFGRRFCDFSYELVAGYDSEEFVISAELTRDDLALLVAVGGAAYQWHFVAYDEHGRILATDRCPIRYVFAPAYYLMDPLIRVGTSPFNIILSAYRMTNRHFL